MHIMCVIPKIILLCSFECYDAMYAVCNIYKRRHVAGVTLTIAAGAWTKSTLPYA